MGAFKDITGQRFGCWTVVRRTDRHSGAQILWECLCDCGTVRDVPAANMTRGLSKSCGCLTRELHEKSKTRTYQTWARLKTRCLNPKAAEYHLYGGRGIRVAPEWERSYLAFLADMGECPEGMSLDRIDNDGDYAPGNCRWADATTQANNRRSNRQVTACGQTATIAEWSRKTGIPQTLIRQRIETCGWSEEKAVTAPVREWGPGKPRSLPK